MWNELEPNGVSMSINVIFHVFIFLHSSLEYAMSIIRLL